MTTKIRRTWLVVGVAVAALAPSVAFARDQTANADDVLLVHGRNGGGVMSGSDLAAYWQNATGWYCGNGSRCTSAANYAYDAGSYSWTDRSDAGPVCQLVHQLYASPGVNIAVLGHSAGGQVVVELVSASNRGISSQFTCASGHTVDAAASWVRSAYTTAAPHLGTKVADAVCAPHSSILDVFHNLSCASVVGNIANLLFDQCNNMTNALTTSFMTNNFAAYSNTGPWNVYYNWGTGTGGDDGTLLSAAGWCAGLSSPHDGFISQSSARADGSRPGNWYSGYWADQSHSENRRCDHTTTNHFVNSYMPSGSSVCFAQGVWYSNPY